MKDWSQYRSVLLELLDARAGQSAAALVWAQLIFDPVKQWETRDTGIAAERRLSVKTVSVYHARPLETMQLKNNSELTHYAPKYHLVD